MIARNQLKLQISLAFGAFFRATDTGELSLAFTHLYLHLSRCSMLCRQGRDKGDLVCCTPGKGHRGRQGAHNPDCRSKHPGIKAEHVATSVCTLLISYPATQGKVSSRVQERTLYLQVSLPLQSIPAQQETHLGTDTSKPLLCNCTTPQKQVIISCSLICVVWTTLESSCSTRMSSLFWKLLLPRHKQEQAAPAVQDLRRPLAALPVSNSTHMPRSLCINLRNSQD